MPTRWGFGCGLGWPSSLLSNYRFEGPRATRGLTPIWPQVAGEPRAYRQGYSDPPPESSTFSVPLERSPEVHRSRELISFRGGQRLAKVESQGDLEGIDVRSWHLADLPLALTNVGFWPMSVNDLR